jgi:surface antigen
MRSGRRTLRNGLTLLSSGLLAGLLVVTGLQTSGPTELPDAEPAAGNVYLCYDYSGCRGKGFSDAGYGAVSSRMYWRMYPGHNCTNYVAYRMIQAGMPNERPWSGGGNASEWGKYMSRITDQTPSVGAVAWWGRYDNGSGSAGHVAYVERVESPTTIVVSQDSWGGTFSWRRITKSSGRWPTGFIHFRDRKQIKSVARPQVVGTPRVGTTLWTGKGRWSPATGLRGTWRWYADGQPIPGATDKSFTVTRAQYGKRIAAQITATRSGYQSITVRTKPSARVDWGRYAVTAPTVSGTPEVGQTLRFTKGKATPTPDKHVVWWEADGEVIVGSRNKPLVLTDDLVGKRITAVALVNGEGYYKRTVASAPTAPVVRGEVEVTSPTRVTGRRVIGKVLTARPGATSPASGVAAAYQWLRNDTPIPGATGVRYRLTAADVGRHMSVRVTHSRARFESAVERAHAGAGSEKVRTPSTIHMKVRSRGRHVAISVRVTSPGAVTPTGRMVLSVSGRDHVVWLRNGRARSDFYLVDRGDWWARAKYSATAVHFADRAIQPVRVRY